MCVFCRTHHSRREVDGEENNLKHCSSVKVLLITYRISSLTILGLYNFWFMKTSPHVFRMIRNPVGLYILSHWLFNIQEIFKFLIIVSLTDRLPTWLTDCFQLIGLKPLEDRKIHIFGGSTQIFFYSFLKDTQERQNTAHPPFLTSGETMETNGF